MINNIKNRNNTIDILKGLCIIFMVAGHASFSGSSFIYIFHMSVFFMASGFFFNHKRINNFSALREYIKKKVFFLWLPYVIYNLTFVIFRPLLFTLNFITTNEDITNYGVLNSVSTHWSVKYTCYKIFQIFLLRSTGVNLAAGFWFVGTLFYLQIIYSMVTFFINHFDQSFSNNRYIIIQSIISLVFVFIGCFFKDVTPRCFLYYPIYFLGFIINKLSIQQYVSTPPTVKY